MKVRMIRLKKTLDVFFSELHICVMCTSGIAISFQRVWHTIEYSEALSEDQLRLIRKDCAHDIFYTSRPPQWVVTYKGHIEGKPLFTRRTAVTLPNVPYTVTEYIHEGDIDKLEGTYPSPMMI